MMPRRDATPQENGNLILGYIEDEVRRELNPDDEVCQECAGDGFVFDCFDGFCEDADVGCDYCATECRECERFKRTVRDRVRIRVLRTLDVDLAIAFLGLRRNTPPAFVLFSLHYGRTSSPDFTAEERADSACWVEGLI